MSALRAWFHAPDEVAAMFRAPTLLLTFSFLLLASLSALAQTQTTGRIAGTIKDQNRAVIAGAEVTVVSKATGDVRRIRTDVEGNYTVSLLPPGTYEVRVNANGFNSAV